MSLIQPGELVAWARTHGAHLHRQVEVYDDPEYGLGIRVRPSKSARDGILQQKSCVVSCPFALSMSYLNALNKFPALQSHSQQFPSQLFDVLESHMIGKFFLIQQLLNVGTSFWGPYVKSLPQPDEHEKLGTPLYFTEPDVAWILGTDLERGRNEREQMWKSEWEKGHLILDSAPGWEEWRGRWTWDLYKWAATIFSSRSFVSTLIPEEIFEKSIVGRSLGLFDRIKSPFPVLFPLVDLANHSPKSRVTWFTNATTEPLNLSLITESDIAESQPIFNNYAPKSNTELFLGYGFCIPGNDEVTIAFKPLADDLADIRNIHYRHSNHDGDVQQHVFQIRKAEYLRSYSEMFLVSKIFEDGCIDVLSILLANQREKEFMIGNPDYCSGKSLEVAFASPMARNTLNVLSALLEKLQILLQRILSTGIGLGVPQGSRQQAAATYRQGQIETLQEAIVPLRTLLDRAVSQHTACSHAEKELWPILHPQETRRCVDLVTLDCAFNWLQSTHPIIHKLTIKNIAKELEVNLNPDLNWAELVPDWDYTLWCLWLYITLLIYASDAHEPNDHFTNPVMGWMKYVLLVYAPSGITENHSPACQEFHGEKDELSTLLAMANPISTLIMDCFPTINEEGHKKNKADKAVEELDLPLLNLASMIAREEGFMLDVAIRTDGKVKGGKDRLKQWVLCFSDFKAGG